MGCVRTIKVLIIFLLLFFISKNISHSYTGEAGPPLLRMSTGATTLAVGGGGIAFINEPNYMNSNPAGGDEKPIFKLSIVHQEWIYDVNYESIYLSRGFKNRYFLGLGITYLYLPFIYYDYYGNKGQKYRISQILGIINGGLLLKKVPVTLGINLKTFYNYIPENLYPDQNYFLFAMDFGAISKLNILKFFVGEEPSFTFGFGIKNIGYGEFIKKLPTEFSAGIGYRPIKKILILSQFNIPLYEPYNGSIGIEYSLRQDIFIRGGIHIKQNPMFGVGLGIRRKDVNINISYNPTPAFYNMLSLSIDLNIGRTKIEKKQQAMKDLLIKALKEFKENKLVEALETINDLLEIDPENEIALAIKETIQKQMELNKKLEEIE